jgi:hypothetical protein
VTTTSSAVDNGISFSESRISVTSLFLRPR